MSLINPIVLLLVDDCAADRELVKVKLRGLPVKIHEAETLAEAREKLAAGDFDACLLDLRLPDSDSSAHTVAEARRVCESTPLVVFSGFLRHPRTLFIAGADYCLGKEVDTDTLLAAIIKAQLHREKRLAHDAWARRMLEKSRDIEVRANRIRKRSRTGLLDAVDT